MTLPTGTALHHGQYVVDAFSAEDTIGPMYLATHIPTGRWVQLRVLGSRHPEAIPFPEQRQGFYHYLLKVQALNHPLFSGRVSGFEDEGVCYQVMEASLGHPLVRFVSANHPVPPRQAIAMVRQIGQGLLALKPLGWSGLTLTPDQFWQRPQDSTLTFTGFDWPGSGPVAGHHQEAQIVRKLSHLLYYLLTGERAEKTRAPLAVDVRNRLPGLPYELDTALQLGNRQAGSNPALTLQQWLALLPEGEALFQGKAGAVSPGVGRAGLEASPAGGTRSRASTGAKDDLASLAPAAGAGAARNRHLSRSRNWAPAALVLTALVASFGGLGLGLTARLQPSQSGGGSAPLNLEQSFPPLPDWSGDDPIEAWEVSPARRSLPDYGDRPSRPALSPSPVVQPSAPLSEGNASASSSDDIPTATDADVTAPPLQEDVYFDDREPFTADEVMPASPTPEGQPPQEESSAEAKDPPVAPPAPLPASNQTSDPPAAPPKPLTAPAPLPEPPPSAPAPSTSQDGEALDTTAGPFSGSVTEIAETYEPRTL